MQLQVELQDLNDDGRPEVILRYNVGPRQLPTPWIDVYTITQAQLIDVSNEYPELYQELQEQYQALLPDYEAGASNGWPEALSALKQRIAMAEAITGSDKQELYPSQTTNQKPSMTAVTSPRGSAATNDEDSHVLEALSYIPADARRFAFTHWARLHRHNGFSGNSRDVDRQTRVRFMLQVMKGTQAAAQMDSTYFLFQAQNWGWDSTDLVWEAQADWQRLTESAFLLQFRDDFDFRPFMALLHQRGFATSQHQGVTVYSVPLTQDPDWHYRSHLAHHAVALFPEAKLLVMAPRPEVVQRILDTGRDEGAALLALPSVAGTAVELTGLAAVEMQLGQETCLSYGRRVRLRDRGTTSQMEPVMLTPYDLLVAGHRFENGRQQDTLLFSYADAEQATAEFATRRRILQTGISRRRDVAYGRQFSLQSAAVEGTTIRFRLSPTAALRRSTGWPQTLLGWIQDNDALFAGCTV